MATFRNRHGKWQARVARKGIKPISKSFQNKQDAERWARQVEADIDKGSYTNVALAEHTGNMAMKPKKPKPSADECH
jgi:hypothetical protein